MSDNQTSAGRQPLVPAPEASTDLAEWRPPEPGDFDLADFDWVPVHRKRRADGWSIDRQRRFIETLAATGSVTQAALEVGMSTVSAYRLRNAPDGGPFATAWEIAVRAAGRRLTDIAMDRVIHGAEEPVFDRDGNRVGRRVKYNDRLLMFMLRALQPDRYGQSQRHDRAAGDALRSPGAEASCAITQAVADAVAMLAPPTPEAPHALLPPDELPHALQLAELLDGRLPVAHRDHEPDTGALPAEIETALDAIKVEAAPPHWRPHTDDDDDEDYPF